MNSKLYPSVVGVKFKFIWLRQCVFYVFISAFITSLITNIVLGGKPWCLYVLTSEYVFYTTYMTWDLVETSIIKRNFSILFPICSLLILIEILEPSVSWSLQTLIPSIYLGTLVVSAMIYFLWFKEQKTNVIPLLMVVSGSLISLLIGMIFIGWANTAVLLFSGVSLIIIIVSMVWYRRAIISELKKKFLA